MGVWSSGGRGADSRWEMADRGKEAQSSKVKAQKAWTWTTFPVGGSYSPSVGFFPHLPSTFYRLSAIGYRLSSPIPHLPSAIGYLRSAIVFCLLLFPQRKPLVR